MDLDQFKSHWQDSSRETQQLHAPEKLERIVADTLAGLEKTRTRNRLGNRFIKIIGGFIFAVTLATLHLLFSRPHTAGPKNTSLALFAFVQVGMASLNIWLSSHKKDL